jgi:ATP-binding cassette subfamily C protein EexD
MAKKRSSLPKRELEEVLKKFRGYFLIVGLFSFFINLMMLMTTIYMLAVYDIVMPAKSIPTLIVITGITIAIFIAMGILDYLRSRLLIYLSTKLDVEINHRLYNSTFKMALQYPGRISIDTFTDLNILKNFMSGPGIVALFDAPWFPFYLLVMFLFDPIYGIYGVVATLIILGFTLINNLVTKKGLEKSQQMQREINQKLINQIRNAEVVEAMGMRRPLFHRWRQDYDQFLELNLEVGTQASLWNNLSKSFRMMFSSLMYGVGAYLAINGRISPGMIIAGAVLLGKALAPIIQLVSTWKQLIQAKSAYKRLNDLLEKYPEEEEKVQLPEIKGKLSFHNVYTTPPLAKHYVLQGVTFTLEPGEVLGLIGPSGAGKSSLAKTALGIWKPALGEVRLDGAVITQFSRDFLGNKIGYLPQDIELFEGTIAENISRFREDVSDEEVIEAAKMAGVHQMIIKMEEGYNTKIGPEGVTLSGGQRQRIGLARAMFGKPKLVILDEPNSNLDNEGEEALRQAIQKLKAQGTTVILITHKLPILQLADKILFLRDGKVNLFGPRDQVFAQLAQRRRG